MATVQVCVTMLSALVSAIDKILRARQGIFEYSNAPHCIFRTHIAVGTGDITLADGSVISAGNRLIHLHLWNERVPPFPARGPTLGWARRMCCDLEASLQELAAFLASSPALGDVTAVVANMVFGSAQQTQVVTRLAARYGFVGAVDRARNPSLAERLHMFGENILISMIVLSHNPGALRPDSFRRNRVPVYLHRAELIRRFGNDPSQLGRLRQPRDEPPIPNVGSVGDSRR